MALDHDFFILDSAEHSPVEYMRFAGRVASTRIHDDLLRYISDTLRWVPTLNPAGDEPVLGLNFYGPTVLRTEGAAKAALVLQCWADLFQLGPTELRLTGSWSSLDGEPGPGRYEVLRLNRDEAVEALLAVGSLCARAARSDGALFVLHCGI